MKLVLTGTVEEVRDQVLSWASILSSGEAAQVAPTPITSGGGANGKAKKAPPVKAPVDTTAAASAPPPAAPSPAEPAKSMMPLCSGHADHYKATIKAIPAEPSACVKCAEAASQTKKSKAMTLAEARAVAEGLIAAHGGDNGPGSEIVFEVLQALGAESLSGAEGTKALDPAQYEEFGKRVLAAMPEAPAAPAKPARRSL